MHLCSFAIALAKKKYRLSGNISGVVVKHCRGSFLPSRQCFHGGGPQLVVWRYKRQKIIIHFAIIFLPWH